MLKRSVLVNSFIDPANVALLVQIASKFSSHISLVIEEKTANAKSIMGLISLDIRSGQTINIVVDGEDEQQALPELTKFFQTS